MFVLSVVSSAQTNVGNPIGSQTITQPSGTTFSVNPPALQKINGVIQADPVPTYESRFRQSKLHPVDRRLMQHLFKVRNPAALTVGQTSL
jgi:hypothetical protein